MKEINKNKNVMNKNYIKNKVISEMNSLLDKVVNYNISYMDCYGLDLYYLDEDKIIELESKYDYKYELFSARKKYDRNNSSLYKTILYDYSDNGYECEFNIIKLDVNSNKCKKEIIFDNYGDIKYTNKTKGKKNNKNDYSINYNINNNNINFMFNYNGNIMEIFIDKNIVNIKEVNSSVMIDTDSKNKVLNCVYEIDNKKVIFEITLDAYNDVIDKNVIIRCNDLNNVYSYYIEYRDNKIFNAYVENDGVRRNILDNELIMNYIIILINSCDVVGISYDDNKINLLIELLRDNAFNCIKNIKNDILLLELNKRLEMSLSLIKDKIYKEKDVKKKKITNNK